MRILFVEDHEVFARSAADEFLTGHAVTFAAGVRAAAVLLAERSFDVVLLDHDLPDGVGVELVASALQAGLDVIATSALDSNNEALIAAGAWVACRKDRFCELPALLSWRSSEGVEVVLVALAGQGKLAKIVRLREITGLGLQDAVRVMEAAEAGESLRHLTRTRAALLVRVSRSGGGWWGRIYGEALLRDLPWLTVVPGRSASVYFWALPEPPTSAELWLREAVGEVSQAERMAFRRRVEDDAALAREGPGSLSGPGVSFAELRAELRRLLASEVFWREQVALTWDDERRLSCRFALT